MFNLSYKTEFVPETGEYIVTKIQGEGAFAEVVLSSRFFCEIDEYLHNTVFPHFYSVLVNSDRESSAVTFTVESI